jgi:methyl-accepting chemotaxis protein WspA
MFKDLTIRSKLYLGFGSIVIIILFLLGLAYTNFERLSVANDWDRHSIEVLRETEQVQTAMLEMQNEVRGFLLTGEERFLTPAVDEYATLRKHLEKALALTVDNPEQHKRIEKLGQLIGNWNTTVIGKMIARRRSLDTGPFVASAFPELNTGFASVSDASKLVDQISAAENALLAKRQTESNALHKRMQMLLTIGGGLCIALASVVALLLARALLTPLNKLTTAVGEIAAGNEAARAAIVSNDELGKVSIEFNRMAQAMQDSQANERAATNLLRANVDALLDVVSKAASGDLTGNVTIGGEDAIGQLADGLKTMIENLRKLLNNVQKAGIQVTTSATEIAASAKEQEATGVAQAQTSIEILSTTKEISANTAQLLRTMEEATAVADYTTSATADAQGNLKRMDQTMQQMVSATDSINAKLAALSEKASNINSVLITITKVADQTNILSLNAAIEAEKAGDAGRGFSVVATEIRRLADQTSVSTWDIEQMLREMQSAVSASVMGMDKFSEEIRRSVGEVRQVGEQLTSMMDQVQKLAPQFDLVLQGMQSQAIGASQISNTMMQLNDATQQTVESLKATSEAVHQLQYAASDLQSSVATFSVES